jgi:type VI secretion system protein ImpA
MVNSLTDFNFENYLKPISPELPCGKNLEGSNNLAQLENAAKFTPERQMGQTIVPEGIPDWRKVRELSINLLTDSRDIQIAMPLLCALLWLEGFSGFIKGLSLIKGLLENYWDDVYPRQDPEDGYLLRFNTLLTLCEYKKVLNPIAQIKLTQSNAGEFSWRNIESTLIKPAGTTNAANDADPKLIEAAFIDTPLIKLNQTEQEVHLALDLIQGIVTLIAEKPNSDNAPDLLELINLLKYIDNYLIEKIHQRGVSKTSTDNSSLNTQEKRDISAKSDGIQSRDDVIRALDDICRYFERNEPSSPVPFFMLRAKKLLTMNFMDILRDMAPDAVNQAERICGDYKKD